MQLATQFGFTSNRASQDRSTRLPFGIRALTRDFQHPVSTPQDDVLELGSVRTARYTPSTTIDCVAGRYIPSADVKSVSEIVRFRRQGLPIDRRDRIRSQVVERDIATILPWLASQPSDSQKSLPWSATQASDAPAEVRWSGTSRIDSDRHIRWSAGRSLDADRLIIQSAASAFDARKKLIWGSDVCDFQSAATSGSTFLNPTIFGNPFEVEQLIEEPPEQEPGPFSTVVLNTYKIMNEITITDSNDNPIKELSFSVSLNLGDPVWRFSANSPKDLTSYLNETIHLNINAQQWRFRVESVSSEDRFGRETFAMTAGSLQSIFRAPFEIPSSGSEPSESLASNIAINLIGADATVTWPDTDWLLPAETWSYQNQSRMAAIASLAGAAGLVVYPDMDSASFEVRNYHRVPSWNWNQEPVVTNLNFGDFFNWQQQQMTMNEFNGVYVVSQRFGVSAHVARDGTNGRMLLPEVSEEYLTDVIANQNRGRQDLSRVKPNLTIQANIFISEFMASIPVGELIHINNKAYFVDGINIVGNDASRRVTQQLSMTRYDENA